MAEQAPAMTTSAAPPDAAPPDGGTVRVAVKVAGTWWVGDGVDDVPAVATVDEVLDACTGAAPARTYLRHRPSTRGRTPVPVDDDGWVVPAGRVSGLLTAEGLLVEDRAGRPVVLGPEQVRALACVDHRARAGDVVGYVAEVLGADAATAAAHLAALVAADTVHRDDDPPAGATTGHGAVATASAYAAPIEDAPTARDPAHDLTDTPVPAPAGPLGRLAARARDAYRLSSKLAPLRRALGDAAMDEAPGPAPAPAAPSQPDDDRVLVVAPWHRASGPLLALGMLTAAARHHDGGRLTRRYDIGVPSAADEVLAALTAHAGPAVLLCSDYVWTLEDNLELARAARACCPGLVVVHGGPSAPRYAHEAEAFLDEHRDAADVVVHGEGEDTLVELLDLLAPTWPAADLSVLAGCAGLTYRDPATGAAVRTPDRERIAELDRLPSPYLTGEFDHVPPGSFLPVLAVETNRGCPYGCSFCDWGSATMSRIRKFSLDRVAAELEWAAERRATTVFVADANFGIWSRDVEVARTVAEVRRRTGFPHLLAYTPAKNTTKHLAALMDVLLEAGVGPEGAIGIQSTDPTTLEAIARSNISNHHFVSLAAEFRRRGLPLQAELMLGLPGQTVQSYADDLQFMFDHELTVRTWELQVLPNAPMNDPDYRARHQLEVDDRNVVVTTATATAQDRVRMVRLRNAAIVADRFGLLRHVLRYVQWDHGHRALDVLGRVVDVTDERPDDYPVLAWTFRNYDLHPAPPGGPGLFYDDVRRFVTTELGVPDDSALDTVLTLSHLLVPAPGRTFPARAALAHDYLAYYRSATDDLFRDGTAHGPSAPLGEWGPATFTVEGDPLGLCRTGVLIGGDSRDERLPGDFVLGAASAGELQSPLLRLLPWVAANGVPAVVPDDIDLDVALDYVVDPHAAEHDGADDDGAVPVRLASRTSADGRA